MVRLQFNPRMKSSRHLMLAPNALVRNAFARYSAFALKTGIVLDRRGRAQPGEMPLRNLIVCCRIITTHVSGRRLIVKRTVLIAICSSRWSNALLPTGP